MPIDFANSWSPQPAFLVCGGPSLASYDLSKLQLPGVMSLGVNNAAAFARTSAHVFGDPQWKFHGSLFMDPKCLCFAPTAKLDRRPRIQLQDGTFRFLNRTLRQLPNVYGFARSGYFNAETFLSDSHAHWGKGGKVTDREFSRLATMLLGIRLLHYLGSRTIYMLGVDFWMSKEQPYAWGGHATSGNRIWWKIDAMLSDISNVLSAAGTTVYNCGANSKCKTFEFCPFEDAISHARNPFEIQSSDLSEWYRSDRMTEDRDKYPGEVDVYDIDDKDMSMKELPVQLQKIDIRICPVCGEEHKDIAIRPLNSERYPFTHWASCQKVGDPFNVAIHTYEGKETELNAKVLANLIKAEASGGYAAIILSNQDGEVKMERISYKFAPKDYEVGCELIATDLRKYQAENGPPPAKVLQEVVPAVPRVQLFGEPQ